MAKLNALAYTPIGEIRGRVNADVDASLEELVEDLKELKLNVQNINYLILHSHHNTDDIIVIPGNVCKNSVWYFNIQE
jgi:ribosomal protein L18E